MINKSNIWENAYGCAEQYKFSTTLYLLSIQYHAYNIVINRGVGAPGHGKYVADGLNVTDNFFITMLIKTIQLTGASTKN